MLKGIHDKPSCLDGPPLHGGSNYPPPHHLNLLYSQSNFIPPPTTSATVHALTQCIQSGSYVAAVLRALLKPEYPARPLRA